MAEVKSKEGRLHKFWPNRQTTDGGRPLDLHSLTFQHNPSLHTTDNPLVVTSIKLGKDDKWSTNLGLFTTKELKKVYRELGNYLKELDEEDA